MSGVNIEEVLPDPPKFSNEDMDKCKRTGDYSPVLFEWYKYAGALNVITANLMPSSPTYKNIPSQHCHVLLGLLNRSARLILANVALSHEGKFGETTVIVDRCIFETSIKILWLCTNPSDEKFKRYYADGLKTEVEFKKHIIDIIGSHEGNKLPIEERMLRSIERHFKAAEMTENEIISTKKLPDLATMMDELGFERVLYVIGQKIGSHHVHGGWTDLLRFYLEENDTGGFSPRTGPIDTYINQLMYIPLIVLRALSGYIYFVMDNEGDAKTFSELFAFARDELLEIYSLAIGEEFEPAPWTKMPYES